MVEGLVCERAGEGQEVSAGGGGAGSHCRLDSEFLVICFSQSGNTSAGTASAICACWAARPSSCKDDQHTQLHYMTMVSHSMAAIDNAKYGVGHIYS